MDRSEPDWQLWLAHFRANRTAPIGVVWNREPSLTETERAWLAPSIGVFQIGESSEGRTLQRTAEVQAASMGEPAIAEITRLFIAEEQLHAALLGAFMDRNALPRLEAHGSDRAFQWLRRLGGFEAALSVLITAELVGTVYYRTLRHATGSEALRQVCARLLRDEDAHVRYEASVLRWLRGRRAGPLRLAAQIAHRVLYAGATLVVAFGHRRALAAGGMTRTGFFHACGAEFERHLGGLGTGEARHPGSAAVPS